MFGLWKWFINTGHWIGTSRSASLIIIIIIITMKIYWLVLKKVLSKFGSNVQKYTDEKVMRNSPKASHPTINGEAWKETLSVIGEFLWHQKSRTIAFIPDLKIGAFCFSKCNKGTPKIYITKRSELSKFYKEIGFSNPKHQNKLKPRGVVD